MNLYWYGHDSVGIDSGENSLIINPLDLEKELKPARSPGGSAKAANVVLVSQPEKNPPAGKPTKTSSFLINNPGEYDVKSFFILGFDGFGSRIAYVIETEGVRLCYLIEARKEISDSQLESLSDIDVLIINVGATDDANETASKVVNQIEPRIVVPIGYSHEKKPSTFLKEMGASDAEIQNKLNIKKKDLPQEETKVVMLNIV